jgi:hypothetical protein
VTVPDSTDQMIADLMPDDEATSVAGTAPDRPALHSLLLSLAGRVPDHDLATMRMCLADEQTDELAFFLAAGAGSGEFALLETEIALVQALLAEHRVAPDSLNGVSSIEQLPPSPYRFTGGNGTGVPPAGAMDDALDAVAVGVADRVGGLIGLWRAFRTSRTSVGQRVYLAEAEPAADVVELTAEMQYRLAAAGEDPPSVEVFPAGAELATYHDAALEAAMLLWAEVEAPVRLARVFDGADPNGGPFFRPDHPLLDVDEGERVLAYLRGAELVLTTPGAIGDVLDAARGPVVSAGFSSDGRWVWPDAAAYYLKRYRLAPDPELTAHALSAPAPASLSRLARQRALEALYAPTGVEPVWQAG